MIILKIDSSASSGANGSVQDITYGYQHALCVCVSKDLLGSDFIREITGRWKASSESGCNASPR